MDKGRIAAPCQVSLRQAQARSSDGCGNLSAWTAAILPGILARCTDYRSTTQQMRAVRALIAGEMRLALLVALEDRRRGFEGAGESVKDRAKAMEKVGDSP